MGRVLRGMCLELEFEFPIQILKEKPRAIGGDVSCIILYSYPKIQEDGREQHKENLVDQEAEFWTSKFLKAES